MTTNPVGRPRLTKDLQRTVTVMVRMTKAEYKAIKGQAKQGGISVPAQLMRPYRKQKEKAQR